MRTEVLKIYPENIDYDLLSKAAEKLKNGQLVVFPTETVYGLGANALIPAAVKNIFTAKGRPSDNPLIVHVSNLDMAENILLIRKSFRARILSFYRCLLAWPVNYNFSKIR